MEYQPIPHLARGQVLALLESGVPAEIATGLLSAALFERDGAWAEHLCVQHLDHADDGVRATAVTGLSHIARLHGALDLETIVPKLTELRDDPAIAGRVSDAIDDIHLFVTARKRQGKGKQRRGDIPRPRTGEKTGRGEGKGSGGGKGLREGKGSV